MKENKWQYPKKISKGDSLFGPKDVGEYLPPMNEIPEEFKKWYHPIVKLISKWFYEGLPFGTEFIPRDGVDVKLAINHISACMRSWDPPHEHKEAGCAYLLSTFFKDIILPEKQK